MQGRTVCLFACFFCVLLLFLISNEPLLRSFLMVNYGRMFVFCLAYKKNIYRKREMKMQIINIEKNSS